MINKFKGFSIILFCLTLFFPAVVFATNDVTVESGLSIELPSDSSSYTVATDTTVQSYTVNDSTIDFVVEANSIIHLSYAGAKNFSVGAMGGLCSVTVSTCSASASEVTIVCPSGATEQTITVTPSGTSCPTQSTSGGGGGAIVDSTAPTISQITATMNDTQSVVKWTTNESSISWIIYGKTTAYGLESKTTSYATSHSLTLTGLTPGTTYHYQVKAKDSAGNASSYTDKTFTTTGTSTTPTTPTTPVTPVAPATCSLNLGGAYKTADSPAVYYVTENCEKRAFSRANVFKTYFNSWSDVKTVAKDKLTALKNDTLGFMPWGPKYDPKYGALVKIVTDPKVYLLLGGEKYWITEENVFNKLSYKWNWIEDIDKALLDKYKTGSEINYLNHHPNYTLVKYVGSSKVYRLEPDPKDVAKQVKRWIPDEKTFNTLNFRWDRIVMVADTEKYADGEKLTQQKKVSKKDPVPRWVQDSTLHYFGAGLTFYNKKGIIYAL